MEPTIPTDFSSAKGQGSSQPPAPPPSQKVNPDAEIQFAARQRIRAFIGLTVGLLIAAALLYFFPPGQYRLYPRCLLYSWTGLQCPGCGGLRAAHHLLHGHFVAAFQLNPLAVLLLPIAALLFLAHGLKLATGRDWIRPLRHPFWLWLLVALAIAFAVARNLPFSPFTFFVT